MPTHLCNTHFPSHRLLYWSVFHCLILLSCLPRSIFRTYSALVGRRPGLPEFNNTLIGFNTSYQHFCPFVSPHHVCALLPTVLQTPLLATVSRQLLLHFFSLLPFEAQRFFSFFASLIQQTLPIFPFFIAFLAGWLLFSFPWAVYHVCFIALSCTYFAVRRALFSAKPEIRRSSFNTFSQSIYPRLCRIVARFFLQFCK